MDTRFEEKENENLQINFMPYAFSPLSGRQPVYPLFLSSPDVSLIPTPSLPNLSVNPLAPSRSVSLVNVESTNDATISSISFSTLPQLNDQGEVIENEQDETNSHHSYHSASTRIDSDLEVKPEPVKKTTGRKRKDDSPETSETSETRSSLQSKKEANKISAKGYRERKRQTLKMLENKVEALTKENTALKKEIKKLKKDLATANTSLSSYLNYQSGNVNQINSFRFIGNPFIPATPAETIPQHAPPSPK